MSLLWEDGRKTKLSNYPNFQILFLGEKAGEFLDGINMINGIGEGRRI
jgi:hypothetical protein